MSSVELIKAPAWQGLTPGLPETVEVSPADGKRILDLVGLSGRLTGLRLGERDIAHYRLQPPAGAALFFKIVEPAQRVSAERAEAIAGWLAGQGVAVAAPLEGYPRALSGGRLAVVSAFIDGRRIRADVADLTALGVSVAHLHRALAAHPDRPGWVRATRTRLNELKRVRAGLATGLLSTGPQPDQLRALAADIAVEFDPADLPSVPQHGDLNPGNVLLESRSGRPILLDFEDVFHGVLPPIFELLLMVERFVLVRIENDDEAIALGRALLNAYRGATENALALSTHSPSDLLRSLALRSLCVLALGEASKIMTADDEWNKFFELDRQARRRTNVLASIFGDIGR